MKQPILSLFLLAALCCQGENIIQQKRFGMDKKFDMHPTAASYAKYIAFDPDGRNGKCIRIDFSNPPANARKFKFPGFKERVPLIGAMNWTNYKPELANDIFQIEVYVKGKGNFFFGLYHYDTNGKHVGIQEAPAQRIDSPDEWKKYTFRIVQDLSRPYYIRSCSAHVGMQVAAGSDIRIDDMTVTQFNDSELWTRKSSSVPVKPVIVRKDQEKQVAGSAKTVGTVFFEKVNVSAAEEFRNAGRGTMTGGNRYVRTANGIELYFDLDTQGEDACMVTCDIPAMEAFNTVTVTMDRQIKGKVRPFIVLHDAGDEKHYFPLKESKYLSGQGIAGSGRITLTCPIKVRNPHGADRISQRWGGDRNQRIDFPVKKITIGIDDLDDMQKASGRVAFQKIEFTVK